MSCHTLNASSELVSCKRPVTDGVHFPSSAEIFLFVIKIQIDSWVYPPFCLTHTRSLSVGIERSGREADHYAPFSDAFKDVWNCTSSPPVSFMARYFVFIYHN
jgi:hypothetical protein